MHAIETFHLILLDFALLLGDLALGLYYLEKQILQFTDALDIIQNAVLLLTSCFRKALPSLMNILFQLILLQLNSTILALRSLELCFHILSGLRYLVLDSLDLIE